MNTHQHQRGRGKWYEGYAHYRFVLWLFLLLPLSGALLQGRSVLAAPFTCNVVNTNSLNLRQGPSTSYKIVTGLRRNSAVTAHAVNVNRTWVRVTTGNLAGWVSKDYLNCSGTLDTLPSEAVAPPVNNPAVNPTPFAISYTDVPNPGGNPDGLEARLLIDRAALHSGTDTPVFSDYVALQIEVRDPDARRGNGIESVLFRISNDATGDEIYTNREGNAPYCLFKNDGNSCNNIWFVAQTDGFWPRAEAVTQRSNLRLDPNIVYRIDIEADSSSGDKQGEWNFTFRIIPSNTPAYAIYSVPSYGFGRSANPNYEGEPRIQSDTLTDIGARFPIFRRRLAFQLFIHDGSGSNGAGVGEVQFVIQDKESGEIVYQNSEGQRPYCLFGNSQPYCERVWRFAETGNYWPLPDRDRFEPGPFPVRFEHDYQATMVVIDSAGNTIGSWEFDFQMME